MLARLRPWHSNKNNNKTMKHTLFLTMMAAVLLGSGVANAAETLYPKDYAGGAIVLGSTEDYDKLVVDTPLTLTSAYGCLDLYNGATIQFQKGQAAEAICGISTSAKLYEGFNSVYFKNLADVYISFDAGAQTVVAASAGKAITLIQDLAMASKGFSVAPTATLTLNGVGYNQTVEMGGVQFTYVGPQEDTYTFKAGEIGFTGYYAGSHALNLVVGGGSVPEPTTGSLSLLALAGLCARRRRK